MRASELLLIVRAQNQASGALRRVAGDLKGLSTMGGLRARGQSLQIARNQMQLGRQIAANELKSLETGKRAIGMARDRLAAENALANAKLRVARVTDSQAGREAQVLRNQAQMSRLERGRRLAPSSAIRDELSMRLKAARIDSERLAAKQAYLARQMDVASASVTKQSMALQALSAREAEAAARADVLRNRIATYGDRLRLNTAQIAANNKAMSDARWDKVAAGGRILQHSARIAQYAGLVLGGTLAVMANNAAKFDTSVTLAATQTRKAGQSFKDTAANSKVLQEDIRSLMTQFPAQADDFSKAAYDIYSSTSVSFAGGRKALKLFAQAAVAGMTTVQVATDMGITVLNNFKGGMADLPNKMQKSFAAVRFGRITFEQFATSMSTIAPAARAANQSFDEMIGTFAFLTRHLDVAKARVGFARVLEALSSPKMLKGLKDVGITVEDATHHLLPLHEIIGKIVTKFPQLRRGGTDAMNFFKNIGGNTGTIQARRAFTFLVQFFDKAGKDGRSYMQMLGDVKKDHNEFTESLKAMEKTTGVRWGVFVNQLKALALAIGASVVPALLQMAPYLERIVHWWQKLDEGTKNMVGRWAAYAAVFMLVGGALAFVSGTLIRMFSFFGRYIGLMGSLSAMFVLVGLTAAALTGHITALTDVLDVITNFAFGSWQGFAITLGIAAVAAVKLTGAMRGLAAAQLTVGRGGVISGLLGIGGNMAAGARVGMAAGGLRGMFAGAAAGATGLGAAIAPIAGIVAAIGGGLLLWKLHMMAVAGEAKRVKEAFDIGAAPRKFGDVFQQLVGSTEDVERSRISIRGINREIASLTKQLAGARGAQRLAILDQLKSLTMDRANAMNALAAATQKNNIQFNAFAKQLGSFVAIRDKAKGLSQEIARLQAFLQTPGGIRASGAIRGQIADLQNQFRALTAQAVASSAGVQRSFDQIVKGWAKLGEFKMPTNKIMGDLFNVAKGMGRMLTIPEIRAVIKAELDPASARALPGKIGAIFRGVKAQRIKIEADDKATAKLKAAQRTVPKALRFPAFTFPSAAPQVKKAQQVAQNAMKPINAHIKVHPPGSGELASIGASITAGIQAGMPAVHQSVVRDVTVNQFKNTLGIKSPSSVMAQEVGKPMMQGITQGILKNVGMLETAATASIEFFTSAAIQKAQEGKKKISDALLIGDIKIQTGTLTQFNNAIAKLTKRHVPKELIDELAAQGPQAAKFIAQIANMSEKELRRYVQAWLRANAQVKRSVRATQADIKKATKDFHDSLLSTIQDMYTSLRETTATQFGDLFAGIDPATYGQGLKDARAAYASQIKDFQGQIGDLNNQLVDAQREASQRLIDAIAARKDELQQAFGQLFGGDWLASATVQTKLEWGKKLGFDDLQKDLQSQVDKFRRWRELLVSLASKVPPELAKQLEALGPEAVDKLEVLNSGTDQQITQYVATWQDGQNQMQAIANKTTVDTSDIMARMSDIVKQIADVMQQMAALQYPKELTGEDLINDLQTQMDQWNTYQDLLQGLIDKGLPPALIEQLSQLGPQAIPMLNALNNMTAGQLDKYVKMWQEKEDTITTDTLKHLNQQLDLWFDYGVNIAQNIVRGIRSQGDYLKDYFTEIVKSLIEENQLPAPPPNRPTGAEGPAHIGTGSSGGVISTLVNPPANQIYNLTVNQAQGESLPATLEKATFRLVNRRTD